MHEINKSIAHLKLPDRMRHLHISETGYPVPWFVAWIKDGTRAEPGKGTPDFRVIDTPKVASAYKGSLCWLCGQKLGQYKTFTIGPMCLVNMTSAELPSHLECAAYAVKACPFLSKPKMRRNEKEMPAHQGMPGIGLERNPGVTLLLTTKSFKPFSDGNGGILFQIGQPTDLQWFCEGRKATRAEVLHSIDTGMPSLRDVARKFDGKDGMAALERRYQNTLKQIPAA